VEWTFLKATWVGKAKADCDPDGACWAVITARWEQIIYGFYPQAQRWRVNISFLLLAASILSLLLFRFRLRYRLMIFVIIDLLIVYILYGGYVLSVVPTDRWGGLFLTIVMAVGGMVCSFPLAILLALGRNSTLGVIKPLCITFIELVRGVPLISILFLAAIMLPLFVSKDIVIDNLLCVFIGLTLFEAAYLAEVIRGGLKSVAKGQLEAAAALGMNYWQIVTYITLPQALRTAIPGILNSFISLFKDTTLVLIIGIYDFLGIVQVATTDPLWLGTALEAYLFCALIYWVFCFGMSRYSKHLEKKLRVRSF
jgi:general L-amino acid transport system permease protein